MQSRLALCARCIKEVEEKLTKLQLSVHDKDSRYKIAEALSFIEEARKAVTATQERIASLKSAHGPSQSKAALSGR
jgi:hypothetical protein